MQGWIKLGLASAAALALTGCAKMHMESAQSECATFGHGSGTPEYAACVERQYAAKRQALQGALRAMGEAGRTEAPAFGPATGPMRVLRRSYVSGVNRICVYDEGVSERVITIGATDLCPIS